MNHKQTHRFWRSAAQCLLGGIAVALVTFVSFRLSVSITTAALLYLIVVVLASLTGSFVLSAVVSIIAILCLDYFFIEPLFTIDVTLREPLNLVVLITFLGTALVITSLMSKVRKSFQETQALKDQLRLVIDTIPALAWSALPDGSVDFLNQRWLEYTGLSLEEGLSQGWQAAIHPENRARFVDEWRAALAAGKPLETEARVRWADGEYRWFLIRAVPLRDEKGNIVKWYGTSTDIEDRRRAEVLLAGEKRLLEMITKGDSLALILDVLCRLVEEQSSGALSSVLLLDPNSNRLRHGAAPSLPKSYIEAIDGIVIGPSVGSCGTAAYRAQPVVVSNIATDPLWTDYRDLALMHSLRACWSTPILSSEGRVLGTFAVYYREARSPRPQDHEVMEQITHLACVAVERKRSEELLRERASLLDLTHDTIFVRDLNDVITYWNRGAEELYGWKREEAVGKVSHQLTQTIFPAPLEEINAELLRTSRWDGELVHTKRDGTQVIVASRWSMQRDERGKPIAVLETNNDITERKQAEEALRKAQGELAHVTRVMTIGELTASIAHEVNQPLSGIVTNANACRRWLAGATPNLNEARDAVGRILRDGNRASDVITRIRALVRKTDSEKAQLDINQIVQEVVALMQNESVRKGAALRMELAANVPPVLADRVQLQQVILNLVMNGIEAMSAVTDRSRELLIRSVQNESDQVLVAVQDSGIGIDRENLEKVFTAFYTTKSQGMGMGLAICRSIVENHGGRLWAVSNDGPGTTFQFTLLKYH